MLNIATANYLEIWNDLFLVSAGLGGGYFVIHLKDKETIMPGQIFDVDVFDYRIHYCPSYKMDGSICFIPKNMHLGSYVLYSFDPESFLDYVKKEAPESINFWLFNPTFLSTIEPYDLQDLFTKNKER